MRLFVVAVMTALIVLIECIAYRKAGSDLQLWGVFHLAVMIVLASIAGVGFFALLCIAFLAEFVSTGRLDSLVLGLVLAFFLICIGVMFWHDEGENIRGFLTRRNKDVRD
jgi:hypothetical protein